MVSAGRRLNKPYEVAECFFCRQTVVNVWLSLGRHQWVHLEHSKPICYEGVSTVATPAGEITELRGDDIEHMAALMKLNLTHGQELK